MGRTKKKKPFIKQSKHVRDWYKAKATFDECEGQYPECPPSFDPANQECKLCPIRMDGERSRDARASRKFFGPRREKGLRDLNDEELNLITDLKASGGKMEWLPVYMKFSGRAVSTLAKRGIVLKGQALELDYAKLKEVETVQG